MNFSPEAFTIRQPKIAMWIGVICFVAFLLLIALMTLFPNDTAKWWVYAVFITFCLLGAFITYYCIVWKVKVSGDTITLITVFGKSKEFTFNDVTTVKRKTDGIIIFYGEKAR